MRGDLLEAEGYLVIHCLMSTASTRERAWHSPVGQLLRDARKSKYRGVAVVTSSDSFMARSDFFIKAGFVSWRAPASRTARQEAQKSSPDPRSSSKGATIEEAQEGPHDPGFGSVPYGSKVRGGDRGDVQSLGLDRVVGIEGATSVQTHPVVVQRRALELHVERAPSPLDRVAVHCRRVRCCRGRDAHRERHRADVHLRYRDAGRTVGSRPVADHRR